MRLTEGSNINGFKILTEEDIYNNYYVSPKKVDDKSYASLFALSLNKLYEMGYGTLLLGFKIQNFMIGSDESIDANVVIKVGLENGELTHTMEVKNNSLYDLKNVITARVTDDNNILAYIKINTISDYVICRYDYVNYYTDDMKYGDINEFVKPSSSALNTYMVAGTNITSICSRLKHEDVFKLKRSKTLTETNVILTSDDFVSLLNKDNALLSSIKSDATYEIELVTTFSGNITNENCYIVVQSNNSTIFVNRFKINSTSAQASSIITKLYRDFNKGDVVTVKIVNSQAQGLTLTVDSYMKVKEV